MDFVEGKETVTVSAIFDEGSLQGRLYPSDLGEVDVALYLTPVVSQTMKSASHFPAHTEPALETVATAVLLDE